MTVIDRRALARRSPGVRSLTGMTSVTRPSAPTRPSRKPSLAASAASRVLTGTPRAEARRRHACSSRTICTAGTSAARDVSRDGAGADRATELDTPAARPRARRTSNVTAFQASGSDSSRTHLGVLHHSAPRGPRRARPIDVRGPHVRRRVAERLRHAEPVGDCMGDQQRQRGAAPVQRLHNQPPARSVFGIDKEIEERAAPLRQLLDPNRLRTGDDRCGHAMGHPAVTATGTDERCTRRPSRPCASLWLKSCTASA